MRETMAKLVALASVVLIGAVVLAFAWHQQTRMQALAGHLDPEQWADLYPLHVASFMAAAEARGGPPVDKLAENPFRIRAWAGNAFSLEYNAARPHLYAQTSQRESLRTQAREQPAGCIHCHAAEAPQLIAQYGWDGLHAMTYDQVRNELHHGSSCADCHQPDTMELTITRPALITALGELGVNVEQASRQQMRNYVCAQCHVEYYFENDNNTLTLPWSNGLLLENIAQHVDDAGFSDWQHAETGANMIKMQHPNFELHQASVHGAEDTSCVDCHMPTIQAGGMTITDHGFGNPLNTIQASCMGCHSGSQERLQGRALRIQENTDALLANTELAITELMDSIIDATQSGLDDADLSAAREAHRHSQMRWDFVDADASRGFHAPGETTRLLLESTRIARSAILPATTVPAETADQ